MAGSFFLLELFVSSVHPRHAVSGTLLQGLVNHLSFVELSPTKCHSALWKNYLHSVTEKSSFYFHLPVEMSVLKVHRF